MSFSLTRAKLEFDSSAKNVARLWEACRKTCPHLGKILVAFCAVFFDFGPCLGLSCQCHQPPAAWRRFEVEIDFGFVEERHSDSLRDAFARLGI